MTAKFALKRLTASDLTFFEWHYRQGRAGNQKAINLNADVLTGRLYPAFGGMARRRRNRLGIDLWLAGPAAASAVNLQRKIIKGSGYKNWRLDAELVGNPEGQLERFDVLRPQDLALFRFEGEESFPDTLTIVLFSRTEQEDRPVFRELDEMLGGRRMMSLDADDLQNMCETAAVPFSHPVWQLVNDADLLEAAIGHAPAVARILSRMRTVGLSREALQDARRNAEEIGRLGEELVDCYRARCLDAEEVAKYEWTSDYNAIAPCDFRILRKDSWEKLEVKTTMGGFNREYHLSYSELLETARSDEAYRIARVYEADDTRAKMRISCDQREFGQAILDAVSALPAGVALDGVTIVPAEAMFDAATELSAPPVDDED